MFGGWTSSSRKAMLPVFESNDSLLFYPVQYEGLESSKNIFYTGATTNQQIIPALDYLKEKGAKSLFLVGSDYVFPQTANKIIKSYAAANGIEIKGEEYAPLGHTDFATIVAKVRDAGRRRGVQHPQRRLQRRVLQGVQEPRPDAAAMPVLSVSIAEEEVGGIGVDNIVGQPVAWNYYQTIDTPGRTRSSSRTSRPIYGADQVTSDPMEAAYTSLFLWKGMVEKAKSFDVADVQAAAGGVSYDAPEGTVTVNGENHHIAKTALIGKIGAGRADLHRVVVGQADRARPVPQDVPVGRQPQRLIPRRPRQRSLLADAEPRPGAIVEVLVTQVFNGLSAAARSCCSPRSAWRSRSARWA